MASKTEQRAQEFSLEELGDILIERKGVGAPKPKIAPVKRAETEAQRDVVGTAASIALPMAAPLSLGFAGGQLLSRGLPLLTRIPQVARLMPELAQLGIGPGTRTAIGEGGGGAVGEVINQRLGLTEPSASQVGLAAGAPVLGRLAVGLKQLLPPTKTGARFLNVAGFEQFTGSLKMKLPRKAAADLWRQFDDIAQAKIPMAQTRNIAQEMQAELADLSSRPTSLGPIRNLLRKIDGSQGELTARQVQKELEFFLDQIEAGARTGGTKLGALKRVRAAMAEDLRNVAVSGSTSRKAAEVLRAARKAHLREATVEEILEESTKQFRTLAGSGEAQQFNASSVINKLTTGDSKLRTWFEEAFEVADRTEIIDLLKQLNELPPLPPRLFQNVGSKRLMSTLGTAGAGGAVAGLAARALGVTSPVELGVAAGVGALTIGPTLDAIKVVKMALSIPQGRKLLGRIVSAEGKLSAQGMALLAAGLRAMTTEPGEATPETIDFIRSNFEPFGALQTSPAKTQLRRPRP